MNTLINTTLCYIQKDDCYLMIHRVKKVNDYNKDKWIGIGGKFENGESPFDCVRREVLEETGLILNEKKLEYRGIVTFVCKNSQAPDGLFTEFMHLFWCDDFDGTLIDSANLQFDPSPENAAAVRAAADKGITVALATGRMYKSAARYAEALGLDESTPIISYTGALTKSVNGGTVYASCLPLTRNGGDMSPPYSSSF